jgi:3-phenylpropionate/trans-cinnamate dioxygenase ferredoxin reductase subunit
VLREKLAFRSTERYQELDVDVRLGQRVAEADLASRKLRLESGDDIEYSVLLLATGSTARRMPDLPDALYLRTVDDCDRLRGVFAEAKRVDIVGAGFIGCEVSASARKLGLDVTLYEALEQPLFRVLGPEVGAFIAAVHREHGVDVRTGVTELPVLQTPTVAGVGAVPDLDLATRAGLKMDSGVAVDDLGRTNVEGVFAAGDIARFWSPTFEAAVRVEHFQTARRHGQAVGRSMGGGGAPFTEVPWFWSDQYDINLQYVGAGLPWNEIVVRGEIGRPPFTVFYLQGGELRAAASINDGKTVRYARRLLETRAKVTRDQLADPDVDLKSLIPTPA